MTWVVSATLRPAEVAPGLDGERVGEAVGLNVNDGRVGVGAGADVAGCDDGDGFALADVRDGAGAWGTELTMAVVLVVGCAPMGSPPDGSVLDGRELPPAALADWL